MREWWLGSPDGLAAARNVAAAVASLFGAGGVVFVLGDHGAVARALIAIGLLAGIVAVLLALAEARAKRRAAQQALPDGGAAGRTPRGRRPRIGKLVAGVSLAALVVGMAVAVVLSGDGDETSESAGEIGLVLKVPEPEDLTVAGGFVWLVNANHQTAIRVSEANGKRETIFVDQPPFVSEPLPGTGTGARVGGYRVAARGDRAWIVTNGGMVLSVGAGRRVEILNPDIKVLAGEPALYRGTLWIGGFGQYLYRLQASSGAFRRAYTLSGSPFSIDKLAAGVGSVWAYTERGGPGDPRIHKLTPVAGRADVEEDIMPLDHPVSDLAAGLGGVWTIEPGGTVTWHDPATGGSARPIRVPGGAQSVALGRAAVWVTTGDNAVVRIDPITLDLVGDPIPLPGNPSAISADQNAWVVVGRKLVEIES
jgi:hypothetical protein